jgi:K+-sensing histidine kinase KdpD
MVWGGISHGLKSPLIVITGNLTGVRYRDEILRPVAVPFVRAFVTALILLCMEYIRAFILMGILSHSSNKVALNWSRVDKILTNWQHGAGRYPAGKLGDAVAQMELNLMKF